jgi:lysozyme
MLLATKTNSSRKVKRKKKKPARRFSWWWLLLPLFLLIPFYYGKIYSRAVATLQWLANPLSDNNYPHYRSYKIRIPGGFTVHGIDVSWYQGLINWEKIALMEDEDVKIHFSFIKATEGILLADPRFQRNWRESARAGIIRGAYHYFKPNKSGYWQARFFLQTVDFRKGDLLPVVDVEERGKESEAKFIANLKSFVDEVEKSVGVKPIIYSGYKFYEDNLAANFNGYPLWIAHYYRSRLRPLSGNTMWEFWQHSDKARVNGIRHLVDMNVFNGQPEDLDQLRIR